MGKEMAMVC